MSADFMSFNFISKLLEFFYRLFKLDRGFPGLLFQITTPRRPGPISQNLGQIQINPKSVRYFSSALQTTDLIQYCKL